MIDLRTRRRRGAEIREASAHVVIDAVVAPQDGSGPCRSVNHQMGIWLQHAKKAMTYR